MDKITCCDCVSGLRGLPDCSVDLTVTSPPYGDLRKYSGHATYDFQALASELFRVTAEGGVVVWVEGDQVIDGSESGASFRHALGFKDAGFRLFDTMIWLKPSPAAPTQDRYYDVFEYMFVLSKGRPKTLNLLADRKNLSAGTVSARETRSCREDRRPTGKKRVVKDFSRRFNVWEVSRGQNRTPHPAVFPEQLAADHIRSWSNPGDLVLDPFCGSGTTPAAAKSLGRKFIGFDVSAEYCEIARARVEETPRPFLDAFSLEGLCDL